jgi:hypothetical protein
MTVTQDPQPPRQEGAIGALSDLGKKLISTLPPAFVMLVLINAAFLGSVLWFLSHEIDRRTTLVANFVDRCMTDIGKIEGLGAMQARQDALEHDVRSVEVELRELRKPR